MEKKTTLLNHSLMWGLIFGIVSIIFSLILWFLNILPSNLLIMFLLLLINIILTIVFVVIGIKKYRDGVLGGKIDFGNAFLTGLLIVIFASVLSGIYNVVFNIAIDPQYYERTIQASKDWTSEFMMKKGVPEDTIEETLNKIDKKAKPTPFKMFRSGLIGSIIFGVIICLITAAVLKKDEPVPGINNP
jgi:uncharacterized membrane protein (DUF485 family)